MKKISEMTINEFKEWNKKPLSTILRILREQKQNERLAMMGTKENSVKKAIDLSKKINDMPITTKRRKTHEHKPNNNIRLQITIDCRIL